LTVQNVFAWLHHAHFDLIISPFTKFCWLNIGF
jgi:hypothetical protein